LCPPTFCTFSLWVVLKCLGKFWRTRQSSRMASGG
jgi:hypothetical protein